MQVSIVIPTYYRRKDVDECLDSILRQTNLPKEVLIVDNTPNDEIENLIEGRKNEFEEKNVILGYIRNPRENSHTIAQNIGIENATGDIILFLDGDVVLDENYIKTGISICRNNHSDPGCLCIRPDPGQNRVGDPYTYK